MHPGLLRALLLFAPNLVYQVNINYFGYFSGVLWWPQPLDTKAYGLSFTFTLYQRYKMWSSGIMIKSWSTNHTLVRKVLGKSLSSMKNQGNMLYKHCHIIMQSREVVKSCNNTNEFHSQKVGLNFNTTNI